MVAGKKFWAVLEPMHEKDFHWIFVGLSIAKGNLHIDCQFNPPTSRPSRKIGGVYLEDQKGRVYLGHNGTIGGGRKGIGRNGFIKFSEGKTDSILWPDGIVTDGFCIADISSNELAEKLRDFVLLRREFISSIEGR